MLAAARALSPSPWLPACELHVVTHRRHEGTHVRNQESREAGSLISGLCGRRAQPTSERLCRPLVGVSGSAVIARAKLALPSRVCGVRTRGLGAGGPSAAARRPRGGEPSQSRTFPHTLFPAERRPFLAHWCGHWLPPHMAKSRRMRPTSEGRPPRKSPGVTAAPRSLSPLVPTRPPVPPATHKRPTKNR